VISFFFWEEGVISSNEQSYKIINVQRDIYR